MSDLNRRDFLVTAAATAAAAVISLPVLQAYADAPKAGAKPIDVGTMKDYDKDGVTDKFVKTDKIFVIRQDGKLYASSAICTHKGVTLQLKDDELYCAKHRSHFTFEGTVTGGPAKRSLARYAISVGDDGHVTVDKSRSFEEKKWDDKASFIDIPKA